MNRSSQPARIPLNYFLLVILLSIPIWVIGGSRLPIPVELPASSFIFLIPVTAASILLYRQSGWPGVRELLKKTFDAGKVKSPAWYLPVVLINPLVFFLSYIIMRGLGFPLPEPEIAWLDLLLYSVLFFVSAACEELGWTGYALDPVQNRWGPLRASLAIGLFWALWHAVPDLQLQHPASWILLHRLGTVAQRVIMVWIYNQGGKSVFAAVLFHALNNISWVLFPVYGSHYNPMITNGLLAMIAVAAGWKMWREGRE